MSALLRIFNVTLFAIFTLATQGCMVPREHPFPAYVGEGSTSNLSGALDPNEVNRGTELFCKISFVSLPSGKAGIWITEQGINNSSVVMLLPTVMPEAHGRWRTGNGEMQAWLLRGRWDGKYNEVLGKPTREEALLLIGDPSRPDPELAIPLVGSVEVAMAKDGDKWSEDGKIETLVVDLRTEHDVPVDSRYYRWYASLVRDYPQDAGELAKFENILKQPPRAPAVVKTKFFRIFPKKMWPGI